MLGQFMSRASIVNRIAWLHPASLSAQRAATEEKTAADAAPAVQQEELMRLGLVAKTITVPREVIFAQLLGLLQAPATRLVRLLNEPGSSLVRLLDAVGKHSDTSAVASSLRLNQA